MCCSLGNSVVSVSRQRLMVLGTDLLSASLRLESRWEKKRYSLRNPLQMWGKWSICVFPAHTHRDAVSGDAGDDRRSYSMRGRRCGSSRRHRTPARVWRREWQPADSAIKHNHTIFHPFHLFIYLIVPGAVRCIWKSLLLTKAAFVWSKI